jgi:poly(A) polymerase
MEQPGHDASRGIEKLIARLRNATKNTPYEGRLYLVGGMLRDRALGLPLSGDLDFVLEGNAVELARFLYEQGLSRHYPVLYPRFGTAMLTLDTDGSECAVELVTARSESYHPDSRKPDVVPGTIQDDVLRRDFTINTLLENLHTGELLDITGSARHDLAFRVLRTPVEPRITFFDDPLRMLRAVRFAARFGFEIEAATWEAIRSETERLRPPAIAWERIREEFVKISRLPGARFRRGMELLLESGLLAEFLPEMLPMVGSTQGAWHRYDVWTHTLTALEALPDSGRVELRLGLLWHDIGKPATRVETNDAKGVRFTGHAAVGAEMVREIMGRLKFSNDEIRDVTTFVTLHMRLGEYREEWTDASVKRLIRDCGAYLDDLFLLTRCDQSAIDLPPEYQNLLDSLRERINLLNASSNILRITSPLDGIEIMEALGTGPGPHIRDAKDYLTNEVIEGRLTEGDQVGARELLRRWWEERNSTG